jgi:2-polyprenyl-3-methyl-5-hydroxy-6-metoxy-1,4-benzoquinol methylase
MLPDHRHDRLAPDQPARQRGINIVSTSIGQGIGRVEDRPMRRETTNRIRYIIEDVLPPMMRDSQLFRKIAELAWGDHISDLARFREQAPFLSPAEYEALYRKHPRVHAATDNSQGCIDQIIADIIGNSVCDVGCGTGYLLSLIGARRPQVRSSTGIDFVIDDAKALPGITYIAAKIESLPFADRHFDTVVCTHVIEHILDYRSAIAELRRVCRHRLIIVVPREREYRYTFNPHFNFFPYPHSFLRALHPVPARHECREIGGDIYYWEDRNLD